MPSGSLHIVHLSVLNPVRHTRIFGKLARTQVKLGYRVSILAQGEVGELESKSVELIPTGIFGRMSRRRWLAPFWLMPKAAELKADAYVIHTPELLWRASWLKRKTGAAILYDVHENYALNIRHGAHWPTGVRRLMSRAFSFWENRMVHRWVDGVSFAERVYAGQLGWEGSNWVVLENRAQKDEVISDVSLPQQPYLLYCGTLAEAWGLFESIDLWEKWYPISPIQLVIAGHSQQMELLRRLHGRIRQSPYSEEVTLIGGEDYVPHQDITRLIDHCEAGLALYHDLPQIRGKIPTRFFEFMQAGRPLIFSDQPAWKQLNEQSPFGFPYVEDMAPEDLIERIRNWQSPQLSPADYAWESQVSAMENWLKVCLGK